jgi:hypothetical protein
MRLDDNWPERCAPFAFKPRTHAGLAWRLHSRCCQSCSTETRHDARCETGVELMRAYLDSFDKPEDYYAQDARPMVVLREGGL